MDGGPESPTPGDCAKADPAASTAAAVMPAIIKVLFFISISNAWATEKSVAGRIGALGFDRSFSQALIFVTKYVRGGPWHRSKQFP
jgi:hypothetical protein